VLPDRCRESDDRIGEAALLGCARFVRRSNEDPCRLFGQLSIHGRALRDHEVLERQIYWVSQGSDPTVIGAGVTPGFLFLVMIPSGLAQIGAMILLAVRRSRRSFLPPGPRVS
jgi:hypothetical protein